MELVNTCGIPAELLISDISNSISRRRVRLGSLIAKATFDISKDGQLRLSDEPLPVLRMEEPTPLGFLPRDVVAPRSAGLDLMVLAAAHAPHGKPRQEMDVSLELGNHRWSLSVTGDRTWLHTSNGWEMTQPADFIRMPLTWSRAFGGIAEVWIDQSSPVDVRHQWNDAGRGFDPKHQVEGLERTLGCPPGFPRSAYERMAPNVELPSARVHQPDDNPEPYCWAPLPIDMGLRAKWATEDWSDLPPRGGEGIQEMVDGLPQEGLWFGHRSLKIPVPVAETPVRLTGCTSDGIWAWRWPALAVSADYAIGERHGRRELQPQMAVLRPEQRQMSLTFRTWFRFVVDDDSMDRSVRLNARADHGKERI